MGETGVPVWLDSFPKSFSGRTKFSCYHKVQILAIENCGGFGSLQPIAIRLSFIGIFFIFHHSV